MTSSQHCSKLLFLLSLLSVSPLAARGKSTHLHFYMHDIVHGAHPTAVKVVPSKAPGLDLHFGDIYVIDDPLTEGPGLASKLVGRAQGAYSVSSQDPNDVALLVTANLVFAGGACNGSTLAILSRFSLSAQVAELAVVGGTGRFRMARGYALVATRSANVTDGTILEWNVHVK